ncbi:hypothetical protein TGPRC2_277705 [Toxoplasma gondii TgCatPRC2]|uniref:Uncharacterized protein n=1 Tax=Toxoplasma gondii TgCatPRC2 TaxID=1130821 RepID=A0A151H7D8_TOXGO|nr:hypothetical protein TGPRC2_277705 [Toxoplasma gondii TgCatPRC2]
MLSPLRKSTSLSRLSTAEEGIFQVKLSTSREDNCRVSLYLCSSKNLHAGSRVQRLSKSAEHGTSPPLSRSRLFFNRRRPPTEA